MSRRTVLVTGAAGLVGGICREGWAETREAFDCRLADVTRITDLRQHEEFVLCDITKAQELVAACEGVDTVVHLAAYPGAGPGYEEGDALGETLLQLNIVGAWNAFEAARVCGCRRFVFCSSIGAVDGYRKQGVERTPWDVPVFPSTPYGATKCFGEALGSVFATSHGLSCVCVRLCSPSFSQGSGHEDDQRVPGGDPTLPQLEQSDGWGDLLEQGVSGMSRRDCASLFAACVKATDQQLDAAQPGGPPAFAIVNGISEHTRPWLEPDDAKRALGWKPQDGTAFPRL
jgi:NAD(P)-dependent dehydrogenase (short-subunit alcohol dehydrogenase family)